MEEAEIVHLSISYAFSQSVAGAPIPAWSVLLKA
jgi:hypothetical protein